MTYINALEERRVFDVVRYQLTCQRYGERYSLDRDARTDIGTSKIKRSKIEDEHDDLKVNDQRYCKRTKVSENSNEARETIWNR